MQYHAYEHKKYINSHIVAPSPSPATVSPISNIALSPLSTKLNSCDASCNLRGVFDGKLFTACTKACTSASFTLHVLNRTITFLKMLRSNVVRLYRYIRLCAALYRLDVLMLKLLLLIFIRARCANVSKLQPAHALVWLNKWFMHFFDTAFFDCCIYCYPFETPCLLCKRTTQPNGSSY